MSILPVINQLFMPHADAKRLEVLLYQELGKSPGDFDTNGDRTNYMYLYKLLRSEKPFTPKQKKKLSELLGVDAFEKFSGTIVTGDSNVTATNGSKITTPESDILRKENAILKRQLKEAYEKLQELQTLKERFAELEKLNQELTRKLLTNL